MQQITGIALFFSARMRTEKNARALPSNIIIVLLDKVLQLAFWDIKDKGFRAMLRAGDSKRITRLFTRYIISGELNFLFGIRLTCRIYGTTALRGLRIFV